MTSTLLTDTAQVIAPRPLRAARQGDQVALYLTDGVFLYRVVDVSLSDEMVDIEDCYSLDRVRVSMEALLARRLRVVTPA